MSVFCCEGCHAVNANIVALGLEDFYRLRDGGTLPGAFTPPVLGKRRYEYLDTEAVQQQIIVARSDHEVEARLHIEGIHCAGCVWLVEKLPSILPSVLHARLHVATGRILIRYQAEKGKLSVIAGLLDSLGYSVSPAVGSRESSAENGAERALLVRLGVAGFCAANIMMLAVSLYEGERSGMATQYASFFRWLSLVLALPAICFSALPFFRGAWSGLRLRAPQIDLPISVAIVLGFLLSVWNTAIESPVVYYDSLAVLIFLLLGGRYIQLRAAKRARFEASNAWEVLPMFALRRERGQENRVLTEELALGDEIIVQAGERMPVDGTLLSGTCTVDRSILTGESIPVNVSVGEVVEAGVMNLESTVIVGMQRAGQATRLGRILDSVRDAAIDKPRIVSLSDQVSRYFVVIVLVLAVITFLFWLPYSTQLAAQHAISLLIITCPCALGLAVPVTFSVALGRAAKSGVLIKRGEAIEKLVQAKTVFLDKTGTLSEGKVRVSQQVSIAASEEEHRSALAALRALVEISAHPVSIALRGHLRNITPKAFVTRSFRAGRGVEGVDEQGSQWLLGSVKWLEERGVVFSEKIKDALETIQNDGLASVVFAREGRVVIVYGVEDPLQSEAFELIEELKKEGKGIRILSGDRGVVVTRVGSQLGIPVNDCLGELYPEDKARIVRDQSESSVFVGDGINDAQAMQVACVSIGMRGGIEATLEVADIFVADGAVRGLYRCFVGARRTMQIVRRALTFSLAYNIVCGGLAMAGFMTPLLAAVLMPISSVTVIGLAICSESFVRTD